MKKYSYALFDLANSPYTIIVITFLFGPYFAKHIVGDPQVGAAYWQWTSGICGISIAIFGSLLGASSDNIKNGRKIFFIASTLLCIFFTALFWNSEPSKSFIIYTLLIFFLSNFFYEISQMFYHSLLSSFSSKEERGYVSGLGYAFGFIGILPLLIFVIVFFLKPESSFLNLNKEKFEHIRIVAFIISIWFVTFSMPIFFGLKEKNINETKTESIFVTLKTILWDNKLTDTAKFLIARMFYADGLVVLVTGGGVYAVGVHNYSFKELVILSVVGNLIAGIFSFWGGFLNDKYGSKKVISFSILGLMFGVFCMVLTQNKIQFFVAAMLVATIVGPLQSASRVLMSNIIPEENKGSGFGLFTFAGRSTAFIGPLLVGTVTYFVSQRVGLLAVLPLFIVGFVILKKLKLDDSY